MPVNPVPVPSELPRWAQLEAWQALTFYAVGERVNNGGNLYQATQAGTSAAAGGPAGAGAGIVDGTVLWNFMGAAGTVAPVTDPAEGAAPPTVSKDTGFIPAEKPPAQYFNWWMLTVYLWIRWLADIANQAMTWTRLHTFLDGLVASRTTGNSDAMRGTGSGTGRGGFFTGGATNGRGVQGQGTGSGAGVGGTGGGTAGSTGVVGNGGGGGGHGVAGFGVGSGTGIRGTDGGGGIAGETFIFDRDGSLASLVHRNQDGNARHAVDRMGFRMGRVNEWGLSWDQGDYTGATTVLLGPWVAVTAYAVGQLVSNGGNLYVCVLGGTSAGAGGPTTRALGIADNTVRWNYLRDYNGQLPYQYGAGNLSFQPSGASVAQVKLLGYVDTIGCHVLAIHSSDAVAADTSEIFTRQAVIGTQNPSLVEAAIEFEIANSLGNTALQIAVGLAVDDFAANSVCFSSQSTDHGGVWIGTVFQGGVLKGQAISARVPAANVFDYLRIELYGTNSPAGSCAKFIVNGVIVGSIAFANGLPGNCKFILKGICPGLAAPWDLMIGQVRACWTRATAPAVP